MGFSYNELSCIHAVEPKSNLLGNSINPFGQLGLISIADEVVPPKHPTRIEPPGSGIMADGPEGVDDTPIELRGPFQMFLDRCKALQEVSVDVLPKPRIGTQRLQETLFPARVVDVRVRAAMEAQLFNGLLKSHHFRGLSYDSSTPYHFLSPGATLRRTSWVNSAIAPLVRIWSEPATDRPPHVQRCH